MTNPRRGESSFYRLNFLFANFSVEIHFFRAFPSFAFFGGISCDDLSQGFFIMMGRFKNEIIESLALMQHTRIITFRWAED